jgi:hypothetical protein
MPVSDTIRTLEDAGASMRCADLKKALESIGFEVKD